MRLARLLLRATGRLTLLAMFLNVVASGFNLGLLAAVHRALTEPDGLNRNAVAILAGLLVGKLVSGYFAGLTMQRHALLAVHDLRIQLVRRLLHVPYERIERVGSPRVMAALTDDLPRILGAVQGLAAMAVSAAIVVGGSLYLVYLSPTWSAATFGLGLLGALIHFKLGRRARAHFERARSLSDRLFARYRDLTGGMRELRLHAERRRAFFEDGVSTVTRDMMRERLGGHARHLQSQLVNQGVLFGAIVLALFAWSDRIDLHTQSLATGYALTVLYLAGPLMGILHSVPVFSMANIALERLDAMGAQLGEQAPETIDAGTPAPPPTTFRRIELVQARFAFEAFELGPIDLTLCPGQVTFITGDNGSGKSTLALLLTGLYAPHGGRLLWDGQEVEGSHRARYRQLASTVFFDYHLFDRLWGQENPEGLQVWLDRFDLGDKVTASALAPLATDLSHGQRRRLALAMALHEDRPLLVLDELGADQSAAFKHFFYHELLPELRARGKAVVVVTHDDRYFDLADQHLRLQRGRMVR